MNDELIQRLNDDADFTNFKNWFVQKIDELDTVEGFSKMSREDAGALGQARDVAKSIIYEMLAPFINIRPSKDPSIESIQKVKDKVGL